MAFTEFVCRSGGSNLNGGGVVAGTEPGTGALYTCTNSNWDGTSVFTPTDGSTPASTVTVGDFASVYLDGATVAVFIARVVTVAAGVNGAITLSTTAKSGTEPASGATGRTIKVGGAWKGPNAAENFPVGFITSALTNAGSSPPRVNLKNDAQYNITANVTQGQTLVRFQGYTSTFGDGGRFVLDGGTSGASYILLTVSGNDSEFLDGICQNNGATGNSSGVSVTGSEILVSGLVANSVRSTGISLTGSGCLAVECEAYGCNQSNTASVAGIAVSSSSSALRCISHDNSGSNSSGFNLTAGPNFAIGCIADTNGAIGFNVSATADAFLIGCDAYNNVSDGIRLSGSTSMFYIESCNLIKNGTGGTGWGINATGSSQRGSVRNCGFGAGTQANTSGTTTGFVAIVEIGSVNYASDVTPWVDPANGDFRISLAAAINAGRGVFTQTAASYTGTVGYPDIGASQHLEATTAGMKYRNSMRGNLG